MAASGALAFTDSAVISSLAEAGVAEATDSGYLDGFPDGPFEPKGQTTRAQAAKVVAMALARLAQ